MGAREQALGRAKVLIAGVHKLLSVETSAQWERNCIQLLNDALKNIDAALATPSAPAQEPVAWRYRYNVGGSWTPWQIRFEPLSDEALAKVPGEHEVQAIYTHPRINDDYTQARIFDDILSTLKHARTFITSREKMHPYGIEEYDALVERIETINKEQAKHLDAIAPVVRQLGDTERLARRALATPSAPAQEPVARVVAEWMIQHSYATGHGDTVADMLSELEAQAKERAAPTQGGVNVSEIAKQCVADVLDAAIDGHDWDWDEQAATKVIAAAIRRALGKEEAGRG